MTFLRRLLRGCYSHLDLRERDAQGKAVLICQTCGSIRPMLESEILKGPKFYQDQVLGQPKTTTFRETKFGQKRSA